MLSHLSQTDCLAYQTRSLASQIIFPASQFVFRGHDLVAMMEKGSINPQFIVTYLQPLMLVQLNYYLTQGLNHDEMVRRLRDDMAGFLSPADLDLVFDGTNDLIGPVRELLTREEFARLEKAEVGTRLRKRLSFSSSGTYQLDFIIKKHLFLQRPPRPLVRPQ